VARPAVVSSTDVALLRALARERSVVAASRSVGITRDRAVYRIARLARAFGGPVVRASRGGAGHGGTLLTPLGDRIVRGGFDSVELLDARPIVPTASPNLFRGTYRARPAPHVELRRGPPLSVAFAAEDGRRVALVLDPEAIVVARERFRSSARNVLPATVDAVRPGRDGAAVLVARSRGASVRVAVTAETVRALGLRPGARIFLYVKATALRRVEAPTRGSPRR